MTTLLKTALCAALFSAVSATSANATVLTVTGMEYAHPTTVHIKSVSPGANEFVYAGAFATTSAGKSFDTWCVDIFKHTYFGSPVNDYSLKSGAAVLGAGKSDLLARLASESLMLVKDSVSSGAFQLAIWEIMNEQPGTAYSLQSGNFSAYGASDSSISLAQSWLSHLPASSHYVIDVYQSPTRQNLAVFTAAAVPEPATIGLLGIGLLGASAARRKRRQK